MQRIARRSLLAVVLAASVGLAGCEKHSTQSDAPAAGESTLVVALQADGKTLDPHVATDAASIRLSENLYSTLLRYGERYGEIEPALARSHEVSDDGLTWSFELRSNAHFHGSGRSVTAADVKFSLERIVKKGVRADQLKAIARIDTPDPSHVVLHLDHAFSPLESALAHPMNAIVDREVVDDSGDDLSRVDAGSGAFSLVRWVSGRHLVMERDPRYWEPGLPHLERVVFRPIPDETARMTALRSGEVDLVLDVPPRDARELEAAGKIVVGSVPGTFWEYIGLNTKKPPFDDVRVRQAVAWAIDREQIAKLVHLGRARVLPGGPIPQEHWAYADLHTYPAPDLARARALLDEAGKPEAVVTLKVGAEFPYQVNAAQVIKQQLSKIGIRVRILVERSTLFFNSLGHGDFQMTVVGWVGFVDADEWLYALFHGGGRYNQQGFDSPELDRLLDRGRTLRDRSARQRVYRDAQRIIAEEAPMVFLYQNPQISAWRPRVHGYVVHPTATTKFLRQTEIVK